MAIPPNVRPGAAPGPTTPDERVRGGSIALACLAGFLGSGDTAVNIAFPSITKRFHLDLVTIQWVIVAYVLTYAGLLLLAGRLADRFGHRRLLAMGLVLSTAGFLLCGTAPFFGLFLLGRVVQGLGAAAVLGSAPALVTLAVAPERQPQALSWFQMSAAAGLAAGAPLGGLAIESLSWRWVFLGRAPLAVALLGVLAYLKGSDPSVSPAVAEVPRAPLDLVGAATLVIGLGSLLLVLSVGRVVGWLSLATLAFAIGAVVGLGLFVVVERRSSQPLVDLGLLRHWPFALANILNVVANASSFVIWLLAPFLLLTVLGRGTVSGGLLLASAPAATALAAPVAGRLLKRVSRARVSSVGLFIEAAGLAAASRLGATSSAWSVVGTFALSGVGLGLFLVPNTSFVMASIPRDQQGVAGGMSQMMRTVGVVSGVASANTLFAARRAHHGVTGDTNAAFVASFRDVFLAAALLCLAAAVLSLVRSSRPPRDNEAAMIVS